MQSSKTLVTWVGLFVFIGIGGISFLAIHVSNLSANTNKNK